MWPPHAVCTAQATNRIELQENNISFTSAQFSVGAASDILLDLLCVGDGPTNTLLWLQSEPRATQLPTPLNLTSTSYNEITGWLLVFSPFLQNPEHRDENGLVNLQCYRNFGNVLSVDLRPGYNYSYITPSHFVFLAC